MSWAKRRKLDPTRNVLNVEVPDFQYVHYHSCDMHVVFEDGENVTLHAVCLQNPVTKKWVVNGIDGNGNQVVIDIL